MANSKMKKANVAGDILKRTASLVGGAVTDYFSGAMPTTSSTISEAAKTASKVSTTLSSKSKSLVSTIRGMNAQGGLKKIYNWYMDTANQFSTDFDFDDNLNFDIDFDDSSSELEVAQISETAASANQISESIIMSNHKLLEGQVEITGNIVNKIESQSAILSAGFDSINAKLNDLIEIVTKNSAMLIQTTAAASERFDSKKESAAESMITDGFSPEKLAKLVSENVESDLVLGMTKAMLPMLLSKDTLSLMLSSDEVVKMIVNPVLNKMLPGLEKSLTTIDETINETIMTTLVSLGANKRWGFGGDGGIMDMAAKLFGIDANRKEVSGSRSSLELKATSFDTLTRESIINVIPGYLSKILEKLGGEREKYDYKSRSFKTDRQIRNEFMNATTTRGSIYSSSNNVSNAIGTDDFGSMVYDLMMTDLGSKFSNGQSKKIVSSFSDPSKFVEYVSNELFKNNGVSLGDKELLRIEEMARNIAAKDMEAIGKDIFMQSAKTNVERSAKSKDYMQNAIKYETDLSGYRTSASKEMKHILARNGRLEEDSEGVKAGNVPRASLSGASYTNKALYEIFRVLNRGLNVFQVGSASILNAPFKERGDDFLPKPLDHRPKSSTEKKVATTGAPTQGLHAPSNEEEANLLRNNEGEDGEVEDLNGFERFGRWGKTRGAGLMRAIVSGDQEAVREEFSTILRDVTQVTGDAIKKGAANINDQFGNVTGYLKHKFFGTGYSYQDIDENGNKVTRVVKDNEKGGVFGFVKDKMKDMFSGTKEKASKWFQSVSGYFDYGDSKTEKKDVVGKRKKLITASVGAMLGAGILGGPMGLIMGAVAGNALGGVSGIGEKIKEVFLGYDKETGKGTGILTRLSDAVVLPIKYQFGKTISHIANNLKKNILGPLSDIGQAIKDRIATAAESTFGKVFKTIANIILAPFKGVGKALLGLVKMPISIVGGLTRTASSLGTGVIGAGLSSIARGIATGQDHTYIDENGEEQTISSRKNLHNRAKERNKEIKEDKKNAKYTSYKDYKKDALSRRLESRQELAEYTAEEFQKVEEQNETMIETQTQQLENSNQMKEDLSKMAEEALTEGSLFTHDKGLHDRLDTLIEIFRSYTGNGKSLEEIVTNDRAESAISNETNPTEESLRNIENSKGDVAEEAKEDELIDRIEGIIKHSESETFASSGLGAAATIAAVNGTDNSTDQRIFGQIESEARKDTSSKSVIGSKIREIFNNQKSKKEQDEESGESFFDKLAKFITGNSWFTDLLSNIGTIAAIIAAIKAFLGGEDGGGSGDAATDGVNTVTGVADMRVENIGDYANPLASIYHNKLDASGAGIVNQAATSTKFDMLVGIPAKTGANKYWMNLNKRYGVNKEVSSIVNSDEYMSLQQRVSDADAKVTDLEARKTEANAMAERAEARHERYLDDDNINSDMTNRHKQRLRKEADELSASYDDALKERTAAGEAMEAFDNETGLSQKRQQLADLDAEGPATINNTGRKIVGNIGTAALATGVIAGASAITNKGVSAIATKAGASQETADKLGYAAGAGTAGMLAIDVTKAVIPGKNSFVMKIVNGLKSLLTNIAKLCKADKMLAKFGNKVDDIANKLFTGLKDKIDDVIVSKVEAGLQKYGIKAGLNIGTAGLGYIAGALAGLVSGLCGVEYLFQVKPDEADATMTIIAALIKGIMGTVSMDPTIGWTIILIETLDAIAQGIFDCGIIQFIAQGVYKLIKGDDALNSKQDGLKMELADYNEKYGTNLDINDFNDLVNNQGIVDRIFRGKQAMNEDGSLKFDKAGGRINTGIGSIFAGGEKDYVLDANGNVLRNASGNAIEKKDRFGNTKKVDEKWGDQVIAGARTAKSVFTGRDIYQTDENGNAMVDENGNYVVAGHQYGLFENPGKAFGQMFEGLKIGFSNIGEKFDTAVSQTVDNVKKVPAMVVAGDINGLMSLNADLPEDNPFGILTSGLFTGIKAIMGVPTLASSGFRLLVDGVKNVISVLSNTFSNTIESVKKLPGYVKSGDLAGLITETGSNKDDGAYGVIGTILTSIVKIPLFIPTAVSAVGHKIGEGIAAVVNKVKNFGSMLSEEYQYGQQMLSADSDSSLSDYFKIEDDPEDPMGGFSRGIRIAARLTAIPVALVKAIGRRVGNVISKITGKVKNSINTLSTNAETLYSKAIAGDVSGLWSTQFEEDPENPVGGITEVLFTVSKVMFTPNAAMHWVGNKIKGAFNIVKSAVSAGFSNLMTNHESIRTYVSAGDPGGLMGLTFQEDPSNPIAGITSAIFTVDKVLNVPSAAMYWVGNKLRGVFETVKSAVSAGFNNMMMNHESINAYVSAGDPGGLMGLTFQEDPNNPLGGVTSAIFTVDKFLHVPSAVMHLVGNKIRDAFIRVAGIVGRTKDNIEANYTQIDALASTGDLAGLSSLSFESDPENPAGGIGVALSNIIKIINYPRALVHFVSGKIKNAFDSVLKNVSADKSNMDTSIDSMAAKAQSGDVSGVWETEFKPSESDPLAGVFKAGFMISKLFNTASAVANKVFNAIGNVVDLIKNAVSNVASNIFEGIKNFINSGGPTSELLIPAANPIAVARTGGPRTAGPSVPAVNGVGGNPLDKPAMITSGYGEREKPYKGNHKGIDITPASGDSNASVSSRYSGVVSYVKRDVSNDDTAKPDKDGNYRYNGSNSGGNQVWVDTDDGLRVKSMHLKGGSVPSSIKPGTRIEAGAPIGSMGSTGWSTGPHLHYQVERMNDNRSFVPVNPMMSFMGGPVGTINSVISKANRRGDDAQYTKWISIIKSVKQQIASKKRGYVYGGNSMNITVDGFSRKYRTDCSGMVSHCLSAFTKKNIDVTSNSLLSSNKAVSNAGFTKYTWPGWDKLIPGDIISKSGHVEIYAGRVDGKDKVWNCGSNESCNTAGPTPRSYSAYSVVWRLNSAPTSAVNVLGDDFAAAISDSSSGTSTSSSTSSTPTVASVLNDLGTGFLSVITGGLINNNASSSSDTSTTDASGVSSSSNVDWNSSDTAKKVYEFFTGNGFSPAAAAGILGNMYQESGVDPTKIQGNGKGPAAGIVQWENYNTKSGRWKSMADYAASKGKDWKDLQSQLEFVLQELSSSSMNSFWKNSKSVEGRRTGSSSYEQFKKLTDVTEATYQFEKTFERAGKPNMSNRLKAAKNYLNSFNKTGGPLEDEIASSISDKQKSISDEFNIPIGGPVDDSDEFFNLKPISSNIIPLTDAKQSADIVSRHDVPKVIYQQGPSILNNDDNSASSMISNVNSYTNRSSVKFENDKSLDSIIGNKSSVWSNSTSGEKYGIENPVANKDMEALKSKLDRIIIYLESIVSNTGLSSDLLGSINDKDFVDQGLRNSLNALGKVKKRNNTYRYASGGGSSAASITNLARP